MLLGGRLVDSSCSGQYSLDDWIGNLDVDAVTLPSDGSNIFIHMRSDVSVVVGCDKGFDESSHTISRLAIKTLDSCRLWRAAEDCSISQVDKTSADRPRLQRLYFGGRRRLEMVLQLDLATYFL